MRDGLDTTEEIASCSTVPEANYRADARMNEWHFFSMGHKARLA
jgi:hypothetical protein